MKIAAQQVTYQMIIQDIQYNCDVSDARDHGIYSMCTMVLKLRNLYKWERELEPWQEPEPGDLLDWIEAKEEYWKSIADLSYCDLGINGKKYSPDSLEDINLLLRSDELVYGAGYGRSMKAVFFLAEKLRQESVSGVPLIILGKEKAREMASPFAMAQDGAIIIRREPLRYFLWDQVQELSSSCRSSFQHALSLYQLIHDGKLNQQAFRERLDTIVDEELGLFIYHEVGELLQDDLDGRTLQKIVTSFPGSIIELVCRTIKDVLADTHPGGLLAYCIRKKKETSLSFYIGFLDGLRKKMFPEIFSAWQEFLVNKEWQAIEDARAICWQRNNRLAHKVKEISSSIGTLSHKEVEQMFDIEIIRPLGLEPPGE